MGEKFGVEICSNFFGGKSLRAMVKNLWIKMALKDGGKLGGKKFGRKLCEKNHGEQLEEKIGGRLQTVSFPKTTRSKEYKSTISEEY